VRGPHLIPTISTYASSLNSRACRTAADRSPAPMLLDNMVVENPYHMEPADFLAQQHVTA